MCGEGKCDHGKRSSTVNRGRYRKRFISVLLSVVLTFCMIPAMGKTTDILANAPQNSGDEYVKDIAGLGTTTIGNPKNAYGYGSNKFWKGTYVYYGKFNGKPLLYRVLDKSTTVFSSAAENGTQKMLLDCDSFIKKMAFGTGIGWSESSVKQWLNGEEFLGSDDVFTSIERGNILPSYKASSVTTDGNGYYNATFVGLNGEHIFLLDSKEVTNTSYGYHNNARRNSYTRSKNLTDKGIADEPAGWWLRSYYSGTVLYVVPPTIVTSASGLPTVDEDERYYSLYEKAPVNELGVSPAFNIDPTSIMFTTEIQEPGTDGYGGVYKLTLKDDNLTITLGADGVKREDDKITVDTVVTGTSNRVSILMTDGTWDSVNNAWVDGSEVKYYGKLDADKSFTLPDGYNIAWNTYVLAEQENGERETDYASAPIRISIPTGKKTIECLGTEKIGNPKDATNASTEDYWRGSYVYFGNLNSESVRYRVLDPSTTVFNSSEENTNGVKKMLLDCDSIILDWLWFYEYENNGGWSNSEIKNDINGDVFLDKSGVFSNVEKNAIMSSTTLNSSAGTGEGILSESGEPCEYVPLDGERIFLLDAKEVTNTAYGYMNISEASNTRMKDNPLDLEMPTWWLRTTRDYKTYYRGRTYNNYGSATVVQFSAGSGEDLISGRGFSAGQLYYDEVAAYNGASPAFTIDPKAVMFSTLVKKADADGYGAEYKFTLKDDSLTVAVDNNTPITGCNDVITVATNKSADATSVSVVVTDATWDDQTGWSENPQFLYYDMIDDNNQFRLPEDFDNSLNVYLVAEKVNGTKTTDYASAPVPINNLMPNFMQATVTGYDGNYDGEDHGATISVTAPATGAEIRFKDSEGNYTLTESPSVKDVADSPLTVYYRITADGYTSKEGFVTIKIANAAQSAPDAPTKQSSTINSITLTATEGYEYRCDEGEWQTSNEFTGLEQNTEYTFYQRKLAKTNYDPSPESAGAVIKTDDHSHVFSYSADGATITASCSGEGTCGITTGFTMTINAPAEETLVYDGKETAAVLSTDYDKTVFPGEYTIKYYEGTNELKTAPVHAGTYIAKVTVESATAEIEYTITKADREAPALTSVAETISGKKDGQINGLTSDMEISTNSDGTGFEAVTDVSGIGYASGTYYVRYKSDNDHKASPAATITVEAGRKLTVTFISFGEVYKTVPVDYNTTVSIPVNPVNPGYVFEDWFMDASLDKVFDFDTVITEDIKLYALWYEVEYDNYLPSPSNNTSGNDSGENTKTINNDDGSVATITTKKDKDGRTVVTTVTVGKDGSKDTEVVITDKDDKVLSKVTESIRVDDENTKIVTKTIKKADGYSFESTGKTYASGKVTIVTDETTPKNTKRHTDEVKKANGSVSVKTVETNAKGKTKLKEYSKNTQGKETIKLFSVKKNGVVRLEYIETGKKKVVLPDTVTFNGKEYVVDSVADGAFAGNTTVTSIELGSNIKYIGERAFDAATNLKKLTIDISSLKTVFKGAFDGMPKGTAVVLKSPNTKLFKKAKKKLIKAGLPNDIKVKKGKIEK